MKVNKLSFLSSMHNYGKYFISFKGAIIWSDLPSNIRNISSYNIFKKKVKESVIKE